MSARSAGRAGSRPLRPVEPRPRAAPSVEFIGPGVRSRHSMSLGWEFIGPRARTRRSPGRDPPARATRRSRLATRARATGCSWTERPILARLRSERLVLTWPRSERPVLAWTPLGPRVPGRTQTGRPIPVRRPERGIRATAGARRRIAVRSTHRCHPRGRDRTAVKGDARRSGVACPGPHDLAAAAHELAAPAPRRRHRRPAVRRHHRAHRPSDRHAGVRCGHPGVPDPFRTGHRLPPPSRRARPARDRWARLRPRAPAAVAAQAAATRRPARPRRASPPAAPRCPI